ncbi:uncharacterized protein PHALS_14508 [Plasmopara halstedii]|uniref:Uncharacterized protein n=1 Tax=Plasmopara halstedii TaxID=4781 RepID=A0A0N7L3E6_PLAHL|nr:uncharacterized protein PHALS_14508 [Plasmopara halstedii]CEG35659.1 hypothetical protein PHALS_14508 [Plasmopara halstedii]|eukprot:XP_024572028.1 hypothetical protein PHALS_14508 [Plasmopara halstedii]
MVGVTYWVLTLQLATEAGKIVCGRDEILGYLDSDEADVHLPFKFNFYVAVLRILRCILR